jgi:hypothetical protein
MARSITALWLGGSANSRLIAAASCPPPTDGCRATPVKTKAKSGPVRGERKRTKAFPGTLGENGKRGLLRCVCGCPASPSARASSCPG